MIKFNSIILVLFVMLFTNVSFSQSKISSDGEYWPFPWGTECPFPWLSIEQNDWSFMIAEKKVIVSFYVGDIYDSNKLNLTIIAYDENSRLVAYSSQVYNQSQNIVGIYLKDLTSDTDKHFSLLVRSYDNRLRVEDPSNQQLYMSPKNQSRYCTDTQQTELAVTLTDFNSCPGCRAIPQKHQIAEKVDKK